MSTEEKQSEFIRLLNASFRGEDTAYPKIRALLCDPTFPPRVILQAHPELDQMIARLRTSHRGHAILTSYLEGEALYTRSSEYQSDRKAELIERWVEYQEKAPDFSRCWLVHTLRGLLKEHSEYSRARSNVLLEIAKHFPVGYDIVLNPALRDSKLIKFLLTRDSMGAEYFFCENHSALKHAVEREEKEAIILLGAECLQHKSNDYLEAWFQDPQDCWPLERAYQKFEFSSTDEAVKIIGNLGCQYLYQRDEKRIKALFHQALSGNRFYWVVAMVTHVPQLRASYAFFRYFKRRTTVEEQKILAGTLHRLTFKETILKMLA